MDSFVKTGLGGWDADGTWVLQDGGRQERHSELHQIEPSRGYNDFSTHVSSK